jgi:hypothetical protein
LITVVLPKFLAISPLPRSARESEEIPFPNRRKLLQEIAGSDAQTGNCSNRDVGFERLKAPIGCAT